ncbi:GPCR kinase [Tanacetum coccineum]
MLSALRRSDNKNMLSRSSRIRRKLKDGGEVKEFQRSFRHSDTERLSRSDEVLKLKNFKKDATLKLFKSTNQESTVTGCLGDIKNFLKNRKLDQVVAIVKSCSLNALGDLTVTMKDLSGTIPGTISYKVINEGGYEKDIIVGAAMILANVSVFTPKPSNHYLNITMRNVVEVFRKDTYMKAREKVALMKKAYSTLTLCLGDHVLREITKETSAAGI